RAIRKYMPQMCLATITDDLYPALAQGVVDDFQYRVVRQWLKKTGPAATRIEFCRCIEKCLAATFAMIGSRRAGDLPVFAAKWAFSALLPRYAVFLFSK